MAERFQYSAAGGESAPNWMLDQLLAPGSGYGYTRDQGKKRGGMRSELIDPMGLLQSGSDQYGLKAWDQSFGEGGQITDINNLLRALNFGNVVAQEGSRGYGGSGRRDNNQSSAGYGGAWNPSSYGDDHAPNMGGDINYFTDDYMKFRGWDPEKGAPRGAYFGDKATQKYIKKTGNDPFLSDQHKWLYEASYKGKDRGNAYGREKTDVPGYWLDPSQIRFTEEDLAGIETMEELDQWAMDNYGVDAQTLSAMSNELLDTRQAFQEDPSQWWKDGMIDITGDVPGLIDADLQARLAGAMEDYQARQVADQNDYATRMGQFATSASQGNRHLGRSTFGQALGSVMPEAVSSPNRLSQLGQPGVGYDYGLMQALMPYLQDLQNQQYKYG